MHPVLLLILLTQNPSASGATGAGQPPSALPGDVATVAELFGLIDRELATDRPDSARLEGRLVRAVEAGCDTVLKESGIRELTAADRKALSDDISERIQGTLQVALEGDGDRRRRALEDLGRRATTRSLPAEIVNRWLGFRDGPEGQEAGTVEAKADAAEGGALVAGQVTSGGASGDLKLLHRETRLLAEVGGAGAGNGVIDAGEWVQLQFTVANPSPRPWFSSSVVGRADGVCLWTSSHGAVLAELPAVDGRGPVELWVYVSRDCTGGTRPIRLGVRDTHRSPAAEVELSANLTPLEVLAPRVLNARLDTDDLGSSDGSRKKEVAPGLRFEFSLDLALPTVEAAAVRMSYAAPKDLQPLFAAFAYREVPLGRDTDRIFRAADDLDVTIVGSKAFEAAILQARASRRWVTGRWPARLWLAVDATIDVNRPGEKSPVQPPSPKVAPPSPPAGEKVVALVRRHLSLAPHPVPIVLPDSVAAASGFEISFDASRFAEDYNALAWPAASPAGTPETVREPLRYRYRLYQSLPLMAGGVPDPPPPVAARTAPRTAPAPKAPPVVEAPPSEARQFALDIGGTWTGYTAAAGVDTTLFGSSSLIDVASFSARLMYGTEWVGIVRFGIGMDGRTNDRAAAVHFRETTAEAGAGYLWSLAPSVDLVARGTFLLNFRSLDGSGSAICPAIEAGLTLRGKVTEGFGLYGDLGGQLGSSGPGDLVSGTGFRAGLGISFLF